MVTYHLKRCRPYRRIINDDAKIRNYISTAFFLFTVFFCLSRFAFRQTSILISSYDINIFLQKPPNCVIKITRVIRLQTARDTYLFFFNGNALPANVQQSQGCLPPIFRFRLGDGKKHRYVSKYILFITFIFHELSLQCRILWCLCCAKRCGVVDSDSLAR